MKFALGRHAAAIEERVYALMTEDAAARIARRDASFWGGDAARQQSVANRLGWLDIASRMRAQAGELAGFTADVRAAGFLDAVVLGMGGSSLAPEVLRLTTAPREGHPRLHVLDTTDPASIRALTAQIDAARTLFFVSSKSGTTIEALSLFAYFHELAVATKRERAGENFVAVTDEGTPLQELARQHGFRRMFTNPADIGGRYSALSYFGLAPAAAAGIDVPRLLDAGIAAELAAEARDSDALRLGAALGELARAGIDKCTFIVSAEIAAFGLWIEQLIAESTGKETTGIVPIVGEQLASPKTYGDDRVFVQLRLEGGARGGDDSVAGALVAEGNPVIVIDLEDAHALGREFYRWEYATAVAGHVLGVNPFDEPNVKESKDNTARVLAEFDQQGMLDIDGIDEHRAPVAVTLEGVTADIGVAIERLLEQIGDGGYFAITAYVEPTGGAEAAFADIRAAVRDRTHAATTLGYGPRFLHSTGQLHKGGPPKGVFLQVTAADADDIPVPGRAFTFGQLKRAQAIGDFQALVAHGLPILRVHLGQDTEGGLARLRSAVRAAAGLAPARR